MTKSLVFVVAGMAALAGCYGHDSRSAKADGGSDQGYAQTQPAASTQGQQSGSLGSDASSASSSDAPQGADRTSTPMLESPSTAGADAGGPTTDASASAATTTSQPADIGSSSVGTPSSDEKRPDQRGTVLTNDGPIDAKATIGGSQSSPDASRNDAATSAAMDSLHIDHADSATAQPPLGDAATLGESDNDRQLVSRLRQAVVDDETVSSQGRAVQIQSYDGQIVLKGQVGSQRERQRIGDTAFRESGGKMVINRLEVAGASKQMN